MRWFAIVMLAACNDVPTIAIDDYEAAIDEAACSRALACGTIASRAECDLPNVFEYQLDARFVDAVKDGRIEWDGAAAHACIQESLVDPCDWTSEAYRTSSCPPISRGTLAEGETCMLSSECISNECWNELCTEACCAGVCVGNVAPSEGRIGDPCRTAACAEGYCDGNLCQPFVDEGGACEYLGQCAYGLACKGQRCVPLPDTGEACQPSHGDDCRQLRDRCSTLTYRCEAKGFAGATCTGDDDCGPLYRCGADQRCVLSRAELGESCEYTSQCATPGAICSVFDGCMLPRAAGEPCDYYLECESQICNYETNTCATLEGCL